MAGIIERLAYVIDSNGYVIDTITVYSAEEYVDGNIVAVMPLTSFRRKRWNGTEWVEGATQEEIDELTKVEPITPTAEERINALEEALLLMMMEG